MRSRKAFEFVYRMEPADDAESRRPLFQSWVGKLRELPENAKVSSVRFPEVRLFKCWLNVRNDHSFFHQISQHHTDHEVPEPSSCLALALHQSSRSRGIHAVAIRLKPAKEDLLHAALPVTG